jgi:hypothetical protein
MADVIIEGEFDIKNEKLKGIGEIIAEGIGDKVGGFLGMKGGAGKDAAKQGAMMGVMAGGVMKLVDLIADVIIDWGPLLAVLKLVKAIILLLLWPLIPILKPILQGIALGIEDLAEVMDFSAEGMAWGIDMASNAIIDFANWLSRIPQTLWDSIIKPGWDFFSNIGEKVWNYLKSIFTGTIDVVKDVWNYLKSIFKGTIDVVKDVWGFITEFIGSHVVGVLDILKDVWASIWNLVSGKAKTKEEGGGTGGSGFDLKSKFMSIPFASVKVGDAILRPDGSMVYTSPGDTIGVSKNGLFGGPVININNPVVRSDRDIRDLAQQVSFVLQRELRGRVSY